MTAWGTTGIQHCRRSRNDFGCTRSPRRARRMVFLLNTVFFSKALRDILM